MNLFVKTLTGKVTPIEVERTDTISMIKAKIQDKEGHDPDTQRLVYKSKILDDDKTVEESGIENESTISLVMRLRGGK